MEKEKKMVFTVFGNRIFKFLNTIMNYGSENNKKIRDMQGHQIEFRISAFLWNNRILSSSGRVAFILNDIRMKK